MYLEKAVEYLLQEAMFVVNLFVNTKVGFLVILLYLNLVLVSGDLVNAAEGLKRELKYSEDPAIGSYIYFFIRHGVKYCVDATEESKYKGRLLNHSFLNPNCYTKVCI